MAVSTTAASWHPTAHRSALRELRNTPDEHAEAIKAIAKDASTYQKPSNHPNISLLRDTDGIMRIKHGKYRALCDRYPPEFRILLVEHREYVYERIAEAQARQ